MMDYELAQTIARVYAEMCDPHESVPVIKPMSQTSRRDLGRPVVSISNGLRPGARIHNTLLGCGAGVRFARMAQPEIDAPAFRKITG
jgi:hypothetical protein